MLKCERFSISLIICCLVVTFKVIYLIVWWQSHKLTLQVNQISRINCILSKSKSFPQFPISLAIKLISPNKN